MADWARIEEIFLEAADLSGAERARYLDDACGGDAALRREVESLLAADGKAESALGGAVATAARAFSVGDPTHAGPYKLVREIGRGGMGAVYLGERVDGEITKQVAVKLVQKGWDQSVVAGRFLRERQILAGLEHSNIARLLDGGRLGDGTPYMVMEYVDGLPLDEYAKGLSLRDKLRLFLKICDAVDYAHRKLVVHRDIKPGNILVTAAGEPKLLDFGIGKMLGENAANTAMTRTGVLLMTLDYASPEQIRGREITTATDVYQLGAVLYELLTGKRPHNIDTLTPSEIEHLICEVDPVAPGVDSELDNIVLMAMKKEPARRYPSAREFAADVENYLAHRPVVARPDTVLYRANKFVRRHRIGVAAAAIVAVSVVTGVVMTVRAQRRAEQRFQQVRKLANTFLFDFDAQIRNIAGTTKAREILVKTALEYLDSLSADARSDASLEDEIATAYMRVGDVQGGFGMPNLGLLQESQASYKKALAIRERRAAAAAEGSLERLEVARISLRLLAREPDEAMLLRAVKDAADFVRTNAGTEAGYEVLTDLYRRQSSLAFRTSRIPMAIETGRLAVDTAVRRLSRFSNPLARVAVGAAKETLAAPVVESGHLPEGEQLLREAIALRDAALRESENNASFARGLLIDLLSLCDLLYNDENFHMDRPADALVVAKRLLAFSTEIYNKDTANVLSLPDVASAHMRLALIPDPQDPAAPLEHGKRAVDLREKIFRDHPKAVGSEQNLAAYLIRYANILSAHGRHAEAIPLAERSLAIRKVIADRNPKQPGLRFQIVWDSTILARIYNAAGRTHDARRLFESASKIAGQIDTSKTSLAYAYHAALFFEAWAKFETGRARKCDLSRSELKIWNDLTFRGVYPSFIQPRKAKAESVITANCKP